METPPATIEELITSRDQQYLDYLERHRAFVYEEAKRLHIPHLGLRHDLSKYSVAEFGPYAQYFYGGWPRDQIPPQVRRDFDQAWLAHQHANPHHWQHWLLQEDSGAVKRLLMPEHYVLEMVADWRGAGRAILGAAADTVAWYLKNRGHILLHPETQIRVEELLALPREQRYVPHPPSDAD